MADASYRERFGRAAPPKALTCSLMLSSSGLVTRVALLEQRPKLYRQPPVHSDAPAIAQSDQYTSDSQKLDIDDLALDPS